MTARTEPPVLKTKYAFHALAWLLEPEVVLDIGSMDGADSKRFRQLLPAAELVAFEGNPDNFRAMLADAEIQRAGIRVLNRLVADTEGPRSFYLQRTHTGAVPDNRGTSSFSPRTMPGQHTGEVHVEALRADAFLQREYPRALRVAAWIDVEGHASSVLEGLRGAADGLDLVHVEVQTREICPGQTRESGVLAVARELGLKVIARGAHDVQRDLVLASERWLRADGVRIGMLLRMARVSGPLLSGVLRTLARARSARRRPA